MKEGSDKNSECRNQFHEFCHFVFSFLTKFCALKMENYYGGTPLV
jgi:hypothetical protein